MHSSLPLWTCGKEGEWIYWVKDTEFRPDGKGWGEMEADGTAERRMLESIEWGMTSVSKQKYVRIVMFLVASRCDYALPVTTSR